VSEKRLKTPEWLRINLRTKFFLNFAGLVIAVVSLVTIVIFFFQKEMLLRQAEEKAISLTRTLAYTSLNAILLSDYITLQLLIDSMSEAREIISIVIVDTTGIVLASDQPGMRSTYYEDDLLRQSLGRDIIRLNKLYSEEGQEVWDTVVPITTLNQRIGTARIRFSLEDTYSGLLKTILLIGFLAILLSLLFAYQMARSISRPIQQAVELADEFGKGNLDASLDIERRDEIGHLVETLNKLSRKLKSLIDEKIANENLVMIGEFGSYVIHDLKNPLSGIHLLADGLHRKLPDDHPLKKYALEILLAAQKLEEFTKRTLDISKPSLLNNRPLELNKLIDHTINEIPFHSIEVQKEYDQKMPLIHADRQLLEMALKNLLINAVEAIKDKGIIHVSTQWNGQVVITIRDNGVGIPADRLQNIFRPFFSMKSSGHGLGLAMVKKTIIAHQGTISVESQEGRGSVFTITLPGSV